jgi:anti-repressor protein
LAENLSCYESDRPTVSARDLHNFLKPETPFRIWFPRMAEYGFTEGVDFNPYKIVRVQDEGGRRVSREVTDDQLTIVMTRDGFTFLVMRYRGKKALILAKNSIVYFD